MQNAGLQYGQGVTPVQESPFGGTSTASVVQNSTSTASLRQFRKKENAIGATSVIQNATSNETANSSHVARVAPHNHYPPKSAENYYNAQSNRGSIYNQQSYQEYNSPTVKYSEIAETVPQQVVPHLDHLPPSLISKHKEKEYDMCNIQNSAISQNQQVQVQSGAHQFTAQNYHNPHEIAFHHHHHHQYSMHKDVPITQNVYKNESQYIPKDGATNFNQIPPFLKYNLAGSRNYHPLENYHPHHQRIEPHHPHLSRSLMTPEHHYSSDYAAIDQSRMYPTKQRYYPGGLTNTNYVPPHNYPSHRNVSQQYPTYPASCNYPPPRTNQMGRYALNMERSISPQRRTTYPVDEMNPMNFANKLPASYPASYSYSQHYQQQHRRAAIPPGPAVQEYYPTHPHSISRQYIPEVEENHVASNNIRQYLENWAEEEGAAETVARSREESNEVYVINASDLPQYLENGVPLVTSENGQYIFKSNVSIDPNGAIKILEKNGNSTNDEGNGSKEVDDERVVSLHIVETQKNYATDPTVSATDANLNATDAGVSATDPTVSATDATVSATDPTISATINLVASDDENTKEAMQSPIRDGKKSHFVPQTENFDESLLPTVPKDNANEEILSDGHEELDKIVEDTLTSSNINIPVIETNPTSTPTPTPNGLTEEEEAHTYIPDDLNLDLETKSSDSGDIIDLSTTSKKNNTQNNVENRMKHMPLIDDLANSTNIVETEKKEVDETKVGATTVDETKVGEAKVDATEVDETKIAQIDKICDELRERKKVASSRKKRIFSVDDIINRIGANSIQNRRKSLNSTPEKSEEARASSCPTFTSKNEEDNNSSSSPPLDIEAIEHYLRANSEDVISTDKTGEFLEATEIKNAPSLKPSSEMTENLDKTEELVDELKPPTPDMNRATSEEPEAVESKPKMIENPEEILEELPKPTVEVDDTSDSEEVNSRKRKLKEELTFEERFVEPYQEEEEENSTANSKPDDCENSSSPVQYRSILRVEENCVLLEIGGELVEINVVQTNGKKMITVTPMSNSTIVDFNENYEETNNVMPVLEDETSVSVEDCKETEIEVEKPPPVLEKITEEEPIPQSNSCSAQDIFDETEILNANEIIIGDENLEEEIDLDLQNGSKSIAEIKEENVEKPEETPKFSTKASRKLYEEPPKKPVLKPRRRKVIKTTETCEVVKQGNVVAVRKNNVEESESYSDFRELIKRRKMRKEKLRLKYSQYNSAHWKEIDVKKTNVRNQENKKKTRTKSVEKNKKRKIIEDNVPAAEELVKTPSEDVRTASEIVSTTTKNFQSAHLARITEDGAPTLKPTANREQETHQNETKSLKNSTPRDLTLTKNVNEHCLSRKDHTNLKKKLSIQEYNSRKRRTEANSGGKHSHLPQLPHKLSSELDQKTSSGSASSTNSNINSKDVEDPAKPATIYAQIFAPNCPTKDPRRRNYLDTKSHQNVPLFIEKHHEMSQAIPKILLENPSGDMQLNDYKSYKTALLETASQPLQLGGNLTKKFVENELLPDSNNKIEDNVQINEINTTETKNSCAKTAENYCEVTSSCEEIKTNDWEDSNSPKSNRNVQAQSEIRDDFSETLKNCANLENAKRKQIIDINDFDITSIKDCISTSTSSSGSARVKDYKEEVDSKLNSLNIQIPRKKRVTDVVSEDDLLMHKFLRREKLSADQIKRIRRIIYLKKQFQQLQGLQNSSSGTGSSDAYEVRRKNEHQHRHQLKLKLEKLDHQVADGKSGSTRSRKKKRFRNLYSESPEEDDTSSSDDNDESASENQVETAGEFSVYEGKGAKLIFKRKTDDLLQLQPVVKIQRCGYIETMAKKLSFIDK